MTTSTVERRVTVDEFLNMPLDGVWEFVDGLPVEKQMGNDSNKAALRLAILLDAVLERSGRGVVITECWLRCFPNDPALIRRPDVAFFDQSRLRDGSVPDISDIAPTLAVESLSPRNIAQEIDRKIDEYHAAGIPLVWVLNPVARTLRVHRPNGIDRTYRDADVVTDEPLLSGLTFRVGDLFVNVSKST